jgi:cytochrome c biogenesis protein CcdA
MADNGGGVPSHGAFRPAGRRPAADGGMTIKALYLVLGFLGGAAPVAFLYAINSHRAVPGLWVDLGLLGFILGVSIVFIPIGIAAGLAAAALVHWAWSRFAPPRRRKTGPRAAGFPRR